MHVPLFNQSKSYVGRLVKAVEGEGYSKYLHKRAVNFLVKYDLRYYNEQQSEYIANPDKYLSDEDVTSRASLDLFSGRLPRSLIIKTVIKFFAHRLFMFIGLMYRCLNNYAASSVIRKSYVEDVEALFDDNRDSIVRVIYPFPLSLKRQLRYVKYLKASKKKFILDGVRYSFKDLCVLLCRRNFYSYMRLEARAQFRTAIYHKHLFNLKSVQCSDEYDFGSIFYSRYMLRSKIAVHNSAHGVGKYLPYHFYNTASLLTKTQVDFYESFNPGIEYSIRKIRHSVQDQIVVSGTCVVFLGQYSNNAPALIKDDEFSVLEMLGWLSEKYPNVNFMYKKHPNNYAYDTNQHKKIIMLDRVPKADEGARLIQFSFYSTCHIDPNFEGYKFLLQTKLIRPQIVFGDSAEIVEIGMLQSKILSIIDSNCS